MAATEAEQLQHDHQPDDVARERVAEPGAVRKDEVGLELGKTLVGDARVRQQAEAGVDAVNRLAARNDAVDRSGGLARCSEASSSDAVRPATAAAAWRDRSFPD